MEKGIDIVEFTPAVCKAAYKCFTQMPKDSAVDLDDLVADGLLHLLEYVLPNWDPDKSNFLTYSTRCLWQFYNNKITKCYNRRRLVTENLVEGVFNHPVNSTCSSVFVSELLASISDGATETLQLLLNPTVGVLAKLRFAKNTRTDMKALRQLLKLHGIEWKEVRDEMREAFAEFL